MEKLIIFDCDGVLIDSEIIGSRIYAQILSEYGYPLSTEQCIRKFTGISDNTLRDLIFQESGLRLPKNCIELAQQRTTEAFETELCPLINELLEHPLILKYKKCIASSSPLDRIIRAMELIQKTDIFPNERIFNAAQVKRGKPFPDLFLFAAQQMKVLPENCIVIEDSVAGIQAAQAANMQVIGFTAASHAAFDWYYQTIKALNVPVATNSEELMSALLSKMENN